MPSVLMLNRQKHLKRISNRMFSIHFNVKYKECIFLFSWATLINTTLIQLFVCLSASILARWNMFEARPTLIYSNFTAVAVETLRFSELRHKQLSKMQKKKTKNNLFHFPKDVLCPFIHQITKIMLNIFNLISVPNIFCFWFYVLKS